MINNYSKHILDIYCSLRRTERSLF